MSKLKAGTIVKVINGGRNAQGVDGKTVTVVTRETAERYYGYRVESGELGMYCGILPSDTNVFVRDEAKDRVWGLGENYEFAIPAKTAKK